MLPNVTHIAHINPNVAQVAPDVTHMTDVTSHLAKETSVITPCVNNVMSVITLETPPEKVFFSSDTAHRLRETSPPHLNISQS